MNRSPPKMRSLARRRARRGFTLLLALGLIAVVTAAVVLSLRAVSTESAIQGQERRAREALFAAEAGMAEGRMVVQAMLANVSPNAEYKYTNVMASLGAPVNELGLPAPGGTGPEWFELIPRTAYTLARGTTNAAIDPGANELNGPDGGVIEDYPNPTNVYFRVFLADDDDGPPVAAAPQPRRVDTNDRVWLVSVGEVDSPTGGQPYRTVIRSLIQKGETPGGLTCSYGTKLGCMGNGTSGSNTPSL